MNAAKVTRRELSEMKVVINGAGAAGTAIAKLLQCVGHDPKVCEPVADVIVCDSKGAIHRGRDDLNPHKQELLAHSNRHNREGRLTGVLVGADVFIGVSKANLLTPNDVSSMAGDCIVLAMANPIPEIMPDEAESGGAAVVATGRSDFPNQVNNVLAFPGIFRGALDAGATSITEEMKVAAARALAASVENPDPDHVLSDPFDRRVAARVAAAVSNAWKATD